MFQAILFWQPKFDLLKSLLKTNFGSILVVILNYLIWVILAIMSFILISHDPNIFWQLLLATTLAEIIERLSKAYFFWSRPIGKHKNTLPKGLVKCWYDTGSFPSGHTSKAFFFFLFLTQYQVFPASLFLVITIPLILFRILIGFHYPVDILGGLVVGFFTWAVSHQITFPQPLIQLVKNLLTIFIP